MKNAQIEEMCLELANGRTELVFELLEAGVPANAKCQDGVSLVHHCAYFGDVSALKFLLAHGESLQSLGDNLGLNAAAFHGHWRLCKFLLEKGADINAASPDTEETALHSALCKPDRELYDRVVKVLLAHGANPNSHTRAGAETGAFMRDCRTKGETPLHRAAAFGEAETIQMLLDAGAIVDAKDMYGDTPLSWASWYLRPDAILQLLCHGDFRVRSGRKSMRSYLIGEPPSCA